MEPSTVILSWIFFFWAWYQLSLYSFVFNMILSFIVVLLILYCSILNGVLFPFEHFFLFLFYEERAKSSKTKSRNYEVDESTFDDEITRKLRELTGHIVRDFILDWYNTVSDDVQFVQEAFELLEHIFTCLRTRVASVNSEVFFGSILRFLSRHLSCYKEALEYASTASPNDSEKKRQLVIITYEKLLGHLAMSNYPDTEADHLRALTVVLLKALLPNDYRLTGASLYVVRELISKNVLLPFVDIVTDPNWINQTIVNILDDVDDNERDSTSDEWEETSSASTDSEVVVECEPSVDHQQAPSVLAEEVPNATASVKKAKQDLKVSFSVMENADDLNLDVTYRKAPESSTFHEIRGSPDLNVERFRIKSKQGLPTDQPNSELFASGSSTVVDVQSILLDETNDLRVETATVFPRLQQLTLDTPSTSETSVLEQSAKNSDERISYEDERFFQRIRIPKAVTMKEAFEGGTKYTLYSIEYCAPPLPSEISKKSRDAESQPDTPDQLQHFQVKRRFREFLTLQERLNEKPVIRRLVKNVRGPSRMFPMPIGNMDSDYIEKRRKFLQAYLRELCSFPHVNQSIEMKEFLSYNADPRIAFVRRPSHFIPRFDQMLKNAVHDFFDAASDGILDKFMRVEEVPESGDNKRKKMPVSRSTPVLIQHRHCFPSSSNSSTDAIQPHDTSTPKSRPNPVTKLKNMVLGRTTDLSILEEGMRDFSPFTGPKNANKMTFGRKWRTPENLLANRTSYHNVTQRRTQGDGCDQAYELENDVKNCTSDLVTGPIFRLVRQIWGVKLGVNTLLLLVFGRYVKKFVELRVDDLTTKDQWLLYLETLDNALWPGGKWVGIEKDKKSRDFEQDFAEAQRVLEETFPYALRFVVGEQRYKEGVFTLLDSFQEAVINRHVIYHLLDIIIQLLFPDLLSVLNRTPNVSFQS